MISLDISAQGIEAIIAELEPTEKQVNAALSRTLNRMSKWVQTRTVKGLSTEDIEKLKVVNQFQGSSAFFADKVVESRILVFEVVKSEPEIMERLGLSEVSDLYHVVRTRLIDGEPYVIESTYMPVDLIKNLTFEICSGSIYEYIEDELGLTIGSAHRRIEARKGTDEELTELGGEFGDPIVLVSQVGYLSDGRTFEFSTNVHRYDKYAFETVLMHKN